MEISQNGHVVTMARLVPGTEQVHTSRRGHRSLGGLYKAFGYWDLVSVGEVVSIADVPHTAQAALGDLARPEHVVRATQELCYSWAASHSGLIAGLPSMDDWPKSPCLGVCLVKLRSDYLRTGGVDAVYQVAAEIVGAGIGLDKDSVRIGGGLSWSDLVMFMFADDFPTVMRDVAALNEYVGQSGLPVLKTITIPCVSYRSIKRGKSNASLFKSRTSPELPPVRVEVLAAFAAGRLGPKLSVAQTLFGGEPAPALGDFDIVMQLNPGSTDFVAALLEFRRRFGPELLNTVTRLVGTAEPDTMAGQDVEVAASETDIPTLLSPSLNAALQSLTKHDEPLARNILALYECVNSYLVDLLTRDAFYDLITTMTALTELMFVNRRRFHQPSLLSHLWTTYKDISMAVRQRIASTQRVMNGDYQPPAASITASQKVVQAAGELVHQLLAAHGQDWEGCIVVDWDHDFMRLKSGLITVPHDGLADPLDWWALGHEAGHEHVKRNLKHLWGRDLAPLGSGTKLPKLIEAAASKVRLSPGAAMWFWEEIYAELFDFIVAMSSDWEFYLKTAWRYVQRERYRHQREEFICRSLLVRLWLATANGEIQPDADGLSDEQAIDCCQLFMDEVLPESSQIYRDWLVDTASVAAMRNAAKAWWPLVHITGHLIVSSKIGPETRRDTAEDAEAAWCRRETVGDTSDPWIALKTMRDGRDQDERTEFGVSTAVILSLWHAAVQRYGDLGTQS